MRIAYTSICLRVCSGSVVEYNILGETAFLIKIHAAIDQSACRGINGAARSVELIHDKSLCANRHRRHELHDNGQ